MVQSNHMVSAFNIKEKYHQLLNTNIEYQFLGSLSQSKLDKVLDEVEHQLNIRNTQKIVLKRIVNILIESLQNIYRYTKNRDSEFTEMFVIIKSGNDGHTIITGNYLRDEDVEGIKSRIEMVNALGIEELRDLYRGVLDIGEASHEGGAGLGIIDMAKKSSGKILAEFDEVDNNHAFFTLQLVVNN